MLRLEPGDLSIDCMHDGLSRVVRRRLVVSGRGGAGGCGRSQRLEEMLHQLVQPRKPLRGKPAEHLERR